MECIDHERSPNIFKIKKERLVEDMVYKVIAHHVAKNQILDSKTQGTTKQQKL